ncbi:MAG TPA: cytochrome c [Steroidobacteraceae bacterium]
MRSGVLAAVVVSAALSGSRALAQEETSAEGAAAGDPARGRALSTTCLGCHGIPNYKNAFPVYSVPKLEGQHAEYIVSALRAYKNGERSHMTMHSQASSLSEQDMADIAAYFAGEPLKADDAPEGTAPAASATCVACHGQNGVGIVGMYPTLAGQHEDYLIRALTDYKKGARKNAIMAPMAAPLSDADIRELARYYSQQKPALQTLPLRSSALSAAK